MEHSPTYNDKLQEIMLALGTRAGFSEKSKREFINALYMNLFLATAHGETFLPDTGKELLGAVQKFEDAVTALQHKLGNTVEGAYAGIAVSKEINFDQNELFRQSFLMAHALKREVISRTAKKTPGRDNVRAHSIAKMIAIEYYRHFHLYPRTGNAEVTESRSVRGSKLRLTPYDRVCDIIQKTYAPNGLINFSTRKAAIKEVKNGGGIRPHKAI